MGDSGKNHLAIALLVKLPLQLAAAFVLLYVWFAGMLALLFGSRDHTWIPLLWFCFCVGLALCSVGVIWRLRRVRRVSYVLMLCGALAIGGRALWRWWTVGRFPVVTSKMDWWRYMPFREGNLLVEVAPPAEGLLPEEPTPRLNGALALYPVYAAMAQAMYTPAETDNQAYLWLDGSDVIYDELIEGKRDMIFALAPSAKQQADAAAKGLAYEMTPFCRDAFVFYVNARNPVDNLTTEQIRGIYAGRLTDWKEVGAPKSTKIIPFQRNEGSGSQTTLQKLMGDTPIMPPLKEDRVGGMGEIINDTANYRNYGAALGFSFRYYATELLRNSQIKLLSIDGIAPTVENIRSGRYPLVATAYMVTVHPRTENERRIVDFMLSPQGQELVEKTGYVPLPPQE